MNQDSIIEVKDVVKTFKVGTQEVSILKGLDLEISYGDFVLVFGPSGCGKSTFLHVLLGLEPPTSGQIIFLNEDLYNGQDEDSRADFRKKHIGMVYQQSNWVKSLTVQENVAFPLMLLGVGKESSMSKALEMLGTVGLSEWANYIPTELSGGQQQRVSLARALVNNPEILIADEPTGNLDYESGQEIMSLFQKLNKELGKTVIMVTHDLEYIPYSRSVVRMLDGQIVGIYGESERDKLLSELKFKRVGEIKEKRQGEQQQQSG